MSELVELPDYLPGIGTLYVQPATLPAGPFLAYDRDGELVSTIYMIPLDDLNNQKEFDELATGASEVDHVDLYYNARHPGVEDPTTISCSGTSRPTKRHRSSNMLTRRDLLAAGAGALATYSVRVAHAARTVTEIRMRSDARGTKVWFDPVGLYVKPGTTIRWVVDANVHTATAYHPDNDDHSLRIPDAATPWDSGYLVNPGDSFEITLTEEGVYDYYCVPHELAGMVGRIIVGTPVGPGTLPFDYFRDDPETEQWKSVPEAARSTFPSIDEIMAEKIVSYL